MRRAKGRSRSRSSWRRFLISLDFSCSKPYFIGERLPDAYRPVCRLCCLCLHGWLYGPLPSLWENRHGIKVVLSSNTMNIFSVINAVGFQHFPLKFIQYLLKAAHWYCAWLRCRVCWHVLCHPAAAWGGWHQAEEDWVVPQKHSRSDLNYLYVIK